MLELLYCQTCGEAMLGGYRKINPLDRTKWLLAPDQPELEGLPDSANLQDTYGNYALFWPKPNQTPPDENWDREGFTFHFERGALEAGTGLLRFGRAVSGDSLGWAFVIDRRSSGGEYPDALPALPIKCPSCGDDNERRAPSAAGAGPPPVTSGQRTRSSVKKMRTGFEKVSQVLVDALARQLPEARQEASRLLRQPSGRRQAERQPRAGPLSRHRSGSHDQTHGAGGWRVSCGRKGTHRWSAFVARRDGDCQAFRADSSACISGSSTRRVRTGQGWGPGPHRRRTRRADVEAAPPDLRQRRARPPEFGH